MAAADRGPVRVAIVGAGVGGLSAAYRLATEGHECDVYERWPGLGGEAATIDVGGGVLLERYYHHLFTTDRHMAELCEELGLAGELERLPSTVAMFAEGRLHPFTAPLDLLRYPPMSPLARLRMGLGILRLRRQRTLESLEAVTIREWVECHMGRQAYAKVWGPLLYGKFRDRADGISMAWLWAKLRSRRETSREAARRELLVYPRRSFEAIFERLRDRIEAQGGRVMIDRPAAIIGRADGGFGITPGAPGSFRRGHDPRSFERTGDPERYDGVIATVPSDVFEQLLGPELRQSIPDDYLARARSIEYFAALCLLLELDRPFSPYYWTNVADPQLPFIGLVEQTNLVPAERYGGRRFLYVANYLPRNDPLLELDMVELMRVYEPGLRRVNPAFRPEWVKRSWLFRDPAAQPIVLTNYRTRMPAFDTGVPGLVLANTTQVYPEDRGTNYAVRNADEAVRTLLSRRVPAPPVPAPR